MKNLFKKKANPQAPRAFKEIEQEFQQLSAAASNAQYKVYIHSKELENINKRLVEINSEASARDRLDKEVKEKLEKELQAKAEQPLDLTKSGAV